MRTQRTHRHEAGTTVLAPSGELDLVVVPELRSRLQPAVRPGARVVLDLQDVTFMDSSALAVIITADRRLRATGGSLQLVHAAAGVRRVVRICGLGDRLARPTDRTGSTVLPAAWTVFRNDLV